MKPKTIVLMIVAVVCGLAASYMTSRVIAEKNNNNGDADDDKVVILVATKKIPYGTLIKDPRKYFQEKSFVKGDEPKKAIKSWDQLQDKRTNKPVNEDGWVTMDDLWDPKTNGPEALLPPGMRMVTLKVNVASNVAGFIQANSHVDVVQTIRNGEHSAALTILQNMLVIASDSNYIRDPEKPSNVASSVTLAAKPEDAQKLRLAEAIGDLSLTLRGSEDNEITATKGTRPNDLTKPSSTDGSNSEGDTGPSGAIGKVPDVGVKPTGPGAVAKVEPPPPPKTITQIIYNGETVTKTVFVAKDGEVSTQIEKTNPTPKPQPEKKEDAAKPAPTEKTDGTK